MGTTLSFDDSADIFPCSKDPQVVFINNRYPNEFNSPFFNFNLIINASATNKCYEMTE